MANKKIQTKNKKAGDSSKMTVIALAILLGVLLITTIFSFAKRPSHEDYKRSEAFDSLAQLYVMTNYYIDDGVNPQAPGEVSTGVSDDDVLYITFKETKYENHVGIAERNYKISFYCDKEKGTCNPLASAGDWVDISEEDQAEARKQLEEIEKLEQN
ncbi:hypothetical protein IJH46_01520 [Candidatus Saccharibacteria bacterium]|nr:hypothetical protein [Candidatus Saccharibacteria bacterium]